MTRQKGDGASILQKPTMVPQPQYPLGTLLMRRKKVKQYHNLSTSVRKSFRYMKQIPCMFHNHILEVNDVAGDGHCGFRMLAKTLGMALGADDWFQVRQDLFHEIDTYPTYYLDIIGEINGYSFICNSFLWNGIKNPPKEKWMHFPGTCFIIVSKYNMAVVTLCVGLAVATYLPMRTAPPTKPAMIVMAYVNENHYVEIIIDTSANNVRSFPMPGIIPGWKDNCDPQAKPWEEVFRANFRYYEAIRLQSRPSNYFENTSMPDDE